MERLIKDFLKIFRESEKRKTSPYDTVAEVKRIKDDTAWVHIAGGIDETPVKLTVDAKKGDKVQVRVGGGKAWITGNHTAPPTDDTTAIKARSEAQTAKKTASDAKITAVKASGTATEYLSVETDGVFVHAKDMPKDPTDPEARGVLIDDDVDIIRQGESVASFGETVRVGKQDNGNMYISSDGIICRSEVETLFNISSTGATDTRVVRIETAHNTTLTTSSNLIIVADETDTVNVGDTILFGVFSSPYGMTHTFTKGTAETYTITNFVPTVINYDGDKTFVLNAYQTSYYLNTTYTQFTANYKTPIYTFGTREETSTKGPYSLSMGLNNAVSGYAASSIGKSCIASGDYSNSFGNESQAIGESSFAGGDGSVANGRASVALGYSTKSTDFGQCVVGKNNKIDSDYKYAFIVGNGTHEISAYRSNALTVDWDGNVECNNLSVPKQLTNPTITKTSGNSTAQVREFWGYGKMRMLVCSLSTTASTSAGQNAFVGTISEGARPVTGVYGSGYLGSSGLMCHLGANGQITVRVIGATMASGSAPWFGFTYFVE